MIYSYLLILDNLFLIYHYIQSTGSRRKSFDLIRQAISHLWATISYWHLYLIHEITYWISSFRNANTHKHRRRSEWYTIPVMHSNNVTVTSYRYRTTGERRWTMHKLVEKFVRDLGNWPYRIKTEAHSVTTI